MDSFTLEKVSAKIVLDTRRRKKDNKYPVKYRVWYLDKYSYFRSGRNLTIDEFALLSDEYPPKKIKEEGKMIEAGFDIIKDHIKDLVKEQGFSIESLKKRMSRGMKHSVYASYEDRIKKYKEFGKIGTAEVYRYSMKALQEYAGNQLRFSTITILFLQRFDKHLRDRGKSVTTISMFMKPLQSIVNEARKQQIITNAQHPFGEGKYEIPQEETRKMALTLAQIKQVLDYPLNSDVDKKYRNYWFFLYMASGMNVVDFCNLRNSNISKGKIYYYRQKTMRKEKSKTIAVVILPQMNEVIEKYGNKDKNKNNYIFPILNDSMTAEEKRYKVKSTTSMIRQKMTMIGEALDIGKISSYTARHSYATVLKRSGVNVAYISETLGHSDTSVTQTYLDSFEDDTMQKNAEKLLDF